MDGGDVLHLSTALCPADRERILQKIESKLAKIAGDSCDWTLVATSCVEAGVDLSFQTAFREACSVASLIQVGGRVNRHGERERGIVYSFRTLAGGLLTHHPTFKMSADVLDNFFERGKLVDPDPADVVTKAMQAELRRLANVGGKPLMDAEREFDYPLVAELGRVIDTDTRLVVVAEDLKRRVSDRKERVSRRDLLRGSVQLWAEKIQKLTLEPLIGFEEVYVWGGRYEPDFLGYMIEVLENEEFLAQGGMVL